MVKIKDKKYKNIIKPIIRDSEFKKTYYIEHHGISRMEHMMKISYYSYNIAKKLNMDYEAVARGALLHDFYLDGDERGKGKKFFDTFSHPKKALKTADDNFKLNEKEKNIIVSHMFPIYPALPKCRESVLVNVVDKVIGGYELIRRAGCNFKYKLGCFYVLLFLLISKN